MSALALKELREVFAITAAALGCYLALVANLMGAKVFDWVPGMPAGTEEVPFTGAGFATFFTIVSVVFAVALGFRQSAWESARGTYLFLLHRPLRRDAIFLTKLLVGVGVLLGSASLPIVLYAAWAAVPGHHPSPFAWSMTGPAWQVALLMPLLYLGAFLSGLRPARWFGTRLLPLVACLALLGLLALLPWWWSLGLPLAVVSCALLAANVCHVARVREYA
jgi:ABC-type transport system involved in multi-copper enzyme maturation permease subunit